MSKGAPRRVIAKRLLPQFLLVSFAFLIMVLIGGWFGSRIVNKNINAYGDEAINNASDMIVAFLNKYTTTLNDVAFSIERLYSLDSDIQEKSAQIKAESVQWTQWIELEGRFGLMGFYGYLDIDGLDKREAYFDGSDWDPWAPGEPPYDPLSRLWYLGAHEQNEAIYYSEPYIDAQTNEYVATVSRLLRDADGHSFGVVAVDLSASDIADYVKSLELLDSGYGVLLDAKQRIVIHPDVTLINQELSTINSTTNGYVELAALLASGEDVSAFHFTSYTGVKSVAFYRHIPNGWCIGVIAPSNVFYGDVTMMQMSLSIVGFALMALLFAVLAFMHIKVTRSEESNVLNASLLEHAREAHERVMSMLDATPFGCEIWDKNLNIVDCNKAAVELFRLADKQELIARFHELFPARQPDGAYSADKFAGYLNEIFQKKADQRVFEWLHKLPGREMLPTEITLVRINYAGDITVAAYIRDLREQKQMLGELHQRDHLLDTVNQAAAILLNSEIDVFEENLQHCMHIIARAVDADRMYIWQNHTDENGRLFCTQKQEWSGGAEPQQDNAYTIDIPYDDIPGWEEVLGNNKCINSLVRDMPPSSQAQLSPQGILSIFVAPVFLNDNFWGFVGFDDCHRERLFSESQESILRSGCLMIANAFLRNDMSKEIRESLQEAQSANKAKSDFLSNMSHEIRTPMNAVLGMTELLLHEPLSTHQISYVNDINTSARSLLSIINDILDMSKIEAGKLDLSPVHYDFHSLLDNIHSMFKYVAEKKNIEFRFERGPNLPRYLFGDDIRLRQILTNICGNAVKFTEKGYTQLKVTATKQALLFKIIDTGIGIRKEDIGKLFDPFIQTDMKKNRNIVGTGLGLSISKAFVEMMGGHVMIESEYGHGTIFTVMIPLVEGNKDEVRQQKDEERAKPLYVTGANILVVDDNEFNLKVAKGLLKLSNIDAQTAVSGKEAIQSVQQNEYDIVFMDHMMPEMDGVETTGLIRELGGKYAELPIIALTANAIQGTREMFLANGFNGFVSKPIDVGELNEVLKKWLPADRFPSEGAEASSPSEGQSDPAEDDEWSGFMDAVSQIGEINADIGLGYFSFNKNMYHDSLEFFYKKLQPDCDAMIAQFEAEDISGFAISAHTMKSQLATVGAVSLPETAFRLEMAAKEGKFDVCTELFPEFRNRLVSLHGQLTAIFSGAAKEKEPGDEVCLQKGISSALAFIQEFNRDACLEIISDLLTRDFGEPTNALLEKASAALEDFDFDSVAEILEPLTKEGAQG